MRFVPLSQTGMIFDAYSNPHAQIGWNYHLLNQ